MSDPGVGLADFVVPLFRRRRMIVRIVLVAAVVSVAAALLWPKSWRASVTLLPPERRMDNPLFVPGGFEGIGASLRGITLRHVATPSDIFVAILESRNIAGTIVDRFNLLEDYDLKSRNKAIKRLQENVDVGTTPDGAIRLSAVASSPQLAADLANAFVEELDRLNRTLANAEAAAIREFIENELSDARTRLAAAEEDLRAFQEEYGAIEITEQARAVIGAAAELRAQILAGEVELGVLQRTRDSSHPDVQRARDYVEELRLRLDEIEGTTEAVLAEASDTGGAERTKEPDGVDRADPFPPLSRVPALALGFGRLFRDLKTEEAVMVLLTEQFHRARIEERRSLSTVRVLDEAWVPERRYRPRRTLMVVIGTAGALFFSVVLAFSLEIVDRVRRDPERYAGLRRAAADLQQGIRN